MKLNAILHPVFLLSLLVLLLNDFYLKETFSNQMTGKLSDFTGLIVFPIFIAFIAPSTKKWISIATGVLFVVWKTSLVSPLIDLINQVQPFQLHRVIDYTDYWALLVLPIAHQIITQEVKVKFTNYYTLRFAKISLSLISFFAICATSVLPPAEIPEGTVYIGKKYTLRKSKEKTIEMIKSLGYSIEYHENLGDSTIIRKDYSTKVPYYQTDNIVIYNENSKPVDTIVNVKYTLYELKENKTIVEIINVTLNKGGNVQKWQTLKYLRKQYKNFLEKQMIEKIK